MLFQLAGPHSFQSIEPFLYNLFCGPDVIDFSLARIARQPLAKRFLAAPQEAGRRAAAWDARGRCRCFL